MTHNVNFHGPPSAPLIITVFLLQPAAWWKCKEQILKHSSHSVQHTHTLDFVVPDSGLMTGSSSSSLYIHLSLSPCFCLTIADLVNGSLTRHCVCCRWSLMMGTYYGNDETITLLTTNTLRRLSSSLFGPSHTCLGLSSS